MMAGCPQCAPCARPATGAVTVLLATMFVLGSALAGHAGQFGRRAPKLPDPVSAPPRADLEAQLEKQLERGDFDEAEGTLKAINAPCLLQDQMNLLMAAGKEKDAKRMQGVVKYLKTQPGSQTAAECQQSSKQRADYKLR